MDFRLVDGEWDRLLAACQQGDVDQTDDANG